MPITREGVWFIIVPTILGLALTALYPLVGGALLLLGAFNAFFFRDPKRRVPDREDAVVSPADGRILRIAPADPALGLGAGATQTSIFMSIFNVHVNRAPISGRVVAVDYRPGSFLPAFDHAASSRNERNTITLENGGAKVVFSQIAGIIARRIVFRKHVGEDVVRGERVGMIRYGSRIDVFLPSNYRLKVREGDRVKAGESIIAELTAAPPAG